MNQTTKLINELHKSCRAAIVGIDNIKNEIQNENLKNLIKKQNSYYENFSKKIKKIAVDYEFTPDDINIFMKANSFIVSKMTTIANDPNHQIVETMINGTKMGIKQMDDIICEYEDADEKILKLAKEFKEGLEEFLNSLREFI